MEKTLFFPDYVSTHPDGVVTYNKSNMVLAVHSNTSHLTEPNSCSRAGVHFFLSKDAREPENNGAVPNVVQIIKRVVTPAAEAEIRALFTNTRNDIPARHQLEEIGHKQPATPVQTDNITALGFVTRNINSKQTKGAAMNYWYMRDQQDQKQFRYYWKEGPANNADCYTNHHCEAHHSEVRQKFLTPVNVLNALRVSQEKDKLVF